MKKVPPSRNFAQLDGSDSGVHEFTVLLIGLIHAVQVNPRGPDNHHEQDTAGDKGRKEGHHGLPPM